MRRRLLKLAESYNSEAHLSTTQKFGEELRNDIHALLDSSLDSTCKIAYISRGSLVFMTIASSSAIPTSMVSTLKEKLSTFYNARAPS